MKNVKMGGSLKNSIFKGRGRKKAIFRGNCLKRRGLGQFTNLMGALAKKNGVGGGGVNTQMHTMSIFSKSFVCY